MFQFATKGGNQKPRDPIEEAEAKQRHDQQIQEDWGMGDRTEQQRKGLVSGGDERKMMEEYSMWGWQCCAALCAWLAAAASLAAWIVEGLYHCTGLPSQAFCSVYGTFCLWLASVSVSMSSCA